MFEWVGHVGAGAEHAEHAEHAELVNGDGLDRQGRRWHRAQLLRKTVFVWQIQGQVHGGHAPVGVDQQYVLT